MKTTKGGIILLDAEPDYKDDVGQLTIEKNQEITPEFLTDQANARFESSKSREGDFMELAAIPTIVVEKWAREGFNIMTDKNITARDIVARLRRDNLTAFLSTNKSV